MTEQCQWKDQMMKERTGHSSFTKAKKMKPLTPQTRRALSLQVSMRNVSSS